VPLLASQRRGGVRERADCGERGGGERLGAGAPVPGIAQAQR